MKILITGASGLIGRRLTARLLRQGMAVNALVRAPDALAELAGDGLQVFTGIVEDPAVLTRAAAGCEAVVHLANASGVTDEARVTAVNVGGTEHVLSAARAAGASRVIFTSTISARRQRVGPYGRTKRAAEERLRACGLPFVILRPSLVYGGGGPGLVTTLAHHLRALPVMPVIGNGRIELDPIHVDDVCAVIEACLVRDDVLGRAYDLLGPDRVTLDEFLRRLSGILGVRRPFWHLPAPIALLLARVLGGLMVRPPITLDNVLGLTSPAQLDRDAARRDFPIAWTSLDVGLKALTETADAVAAPAA